MERFRFYKSFDLLLTCLVEHFYFYCFVPRSYFYLAVEQNCSQMYPFQMSVRKMEGKKILFYIYFFKTVLQVILQHANTSGMLCLNHSCTFLETAIHCAEHFLFS